jgi:molecular chaperone DnaK
VNGAEPSVDGPLVGIDLGTTNSVVAGIDRAGISQAIPDEDGQRILPSAVHFPRDGDPSVGASAKAMATVDPGRTAMAFKRGMGERTFRADGAAFIVDGREIRPEELSAIVLARLRSTAEAHFGRPIGGAVITVPAYFGDPERRATITAGELAGLRVLRVINEPTAAAIANGLDSPEGGGIVLVFDLGGGTFDATVIRVDEGSALIVEATGGDHQLGGIDFDRLIVDRMAAVGIGATGVDLRGDVHSRADAEAKAEAMKKELSRTSSATRPMTVGGRSFSFTLTRDEFEGLLDEAGYLQEIDDHVLNVIDAAGRRPDELTSVLFVGGSSRIPVLARRVEQVTGIAPVFSRNPDEDVARGAAMVAAKTQQAANPAGALAILDASSRLAQMPTPQDVASRGLGSSVMDTDRNVLVNQIIIPAGTPVPCKVEVVNQALEDGQERLDLDLTEGDSEELEFVRVLGSTTGSFGRPVAAGHPINVSIEYTADQLIICRAFDGESGAFIAEVSVTDGGMSDEDRARTIEQLARYRL